MPVQIAHRHEASDALLEMLASSLPGQIMHVLGMQPRHPLTMVFASAVRVIETACHIVPSEFSRTPLFSLFCWTMLELNDAAEMLWRDLKSSNCISRKEKFFVARTATWSEKLRGPE